MDLIEDKILERNIEQYCKQIDYLMTKGGLEVSVVNIITLFMESLLEYRDSISVDVSSYRNSTLAKSFFVGKKLARVPDKLIIDDITYNVKLVIEYKSPYVRLSGKEYTKAYGNMSEHLLMSNGIDWKLYERGRLIKSWSLGILPKNSDRIIWRDTIKESIKDIVSTLDTYVNR